MAVHRYLHLCSHNLAHHAEPCHLISGGASLVGAAWLHHINSDEGPRPRSTSTNSRRTNLQGSFGPTIQIPVLHLESTIAPQEERQLDYEDGGFVFRGQPGQLSSERYVPRQITSHSPLWVLESYTAGCWNQPSQARGGRLTGT